MMPTINQLVRKNRQAIEKKSTAPALQKGFNTLYTRKLLMQVLHKKEEFVLQ